MAKLLVILLIGLLFEAVGVVLLKRGINEMGDFGKPSVRQFVGVVRKAVVNSNILLGVFFEALFFACLLLLMSKADVSFLWPMTALSFVFTTIAARFLLHESVSTARWIGVVLIMAGAALITWTESTRPTSVEPIIPGQSAQSQGH